MGRIRLMNNPITPQEKERSKKILESFLGHTGVSSKEAYRVLRALEVSSISDLKGERHYIANQNMINYRTAVQNERDIYQSELKEFIKDSLAEMVSIRKNTQDGFNWSYFNELSQKIVNSHLELQFGDLWVNQDYKFKDRLAKEVAVIILALIRKDKNVIAELNAGLGKDEQPFIDSLFSLNFTISDREASIISISTPIIAEIIFKKKFNTR